MKRVIVTGANGFIGSSMVNYLASLNIEVFAIVRNEDSNADRLNKNNKNVKIVYCDLNQISKLADFFNGIEINTFYHFGWAGVSNSDRNNYNSQLNNIQWSCDCVKLCETLNVKRFIFASSIWEYECCKSMNETNDVKLSSLYSTAKIAANFMSRTLCNDFGITFVAGVITNIYGVGELSPRLINSTIRKLINGEETAFTSSTQMYDFIYIDDAVRAFYYMDLYGVNNKSYYIGSHEPKPLKEFLYLLRNCVNKDAELGIGKILQSGIHLDYNHFNIFELKDDTGFENEVSFEEGIIKTSEWIKSLKGVFLHE
ncbi:MULTISPECIES: NAD(P)-dependent oxidoreductase [unclassified Paenibacillus]|uniref:NAD-dependent epimerase/dehydratase family protein n=1 Tax=unclassified Paenibacillus TaxID=185978 RepID=UPI002406A460|nr:MULTISPECIES: NAD(P)-dependent oxidoreductase [unclassified Paenibacillus]MDF9844041.1 UDP-glucose 4-epimerase [Paenibacillus sp. PastF-2]MDF9850646.1 UDP-glucose 4-epimerase [Paenibacillus sp. PastM-2]MDF9857203.1 UDP-glucose 4-epimerase [Paenibacillus sp. PastF-1]MDH6482496.1 UDP-glucose 4-epimerase [Paenibacillus sp. PastH-2]MDH6509901.1 UDP-glucose 4-epimerase [Paenibacillus sp. PastM-3]